MQIIGSLADRMANLVLPRLTAKAIPCCIYYQYTEYCYCSDGYQYEKACWTDCCSGLCTGCERTTTTCSEEAQLCA